MRSGIDMGKLLNKTVELIYLADIYATMAIGKISNKYKVTPYVVKDGERSMFDIIGGIDMITIFMSPKHIFSVYNVGDSYPSRVIFLSEDVNGSLEIFEFRSITELVAVSCHRPLWFTDPDNIFVLSSADGGLDSVCVNKFEDMTGRVISF